MSCRIAGLSLAGMLLLLGHAQAQVVQLPTFGFFSVQTTVMAPDSGRGYLGGVDRSRYHSSSRGLPVGGRLTRNRGVSSEIGTTGAVVRATIIDHKEWDEAILAAARSRPGGPTEEDFKAAKLAKRLDPRSGGLMSVTEIERLNRLSDRAHDAEALRLFQQGIKAQNEGKRGAAKIFFKMAAKRTDGELKQQIEKRLQTLLQKQQ